MEGADQYSEPGIVGKDSNEVIDARDDTTAAVSKSVLAREAVTYVSSGSSGRGTAKMGLSRLGVTVVVTLIVLVKSVKSEEGQMSYPVSLEEMGVWSPTPLLELSTMLLSAWRV